MTHSMTEFHVTADPGACAGRAVALSGAQRSLWFQYLRYPELKGFFNFSFVIRSEPGLDAARLRPILDELVRRHAMFRVRLSTIDADIVQQLQPDASIALQVCDVDAADEAGIVRLIDQERHTPFDLTRAPLVRATLYRADPAFAVLVVTFDHMVCDGWSGWQISQQICDMLAAGRDAVHARQWHAAPDFFEHVVEEQQWLASAAARKQLEYWRKELAHPYPALQLAYDRNQAESRAVTVTALDGELVTQLRALASRHDVSLYVVLLASYFMLLQRLSGQTQLSVGAPMPGRSRQWHSTVGFFSNTVVLRAELRPGIRVAELLKQVRSTLWRVLKNQSYPYPELMERLRPQREHADHPYFQVWFNHQNSRIASELVTLLTPTDSTARVQCGDLLLRPFGEWYGSGGPGLDLLLETVEVGAQIRVDLNYNAGRFERATAERYLVHWQELLRSLVAADDVAVATLPMLSAAELRQLQQWSTARARFDGAECLHELFEEQAERAAERVAVECGDERLTYRQLNERANRLAHHLRELGVGPEARVALCLERGLAMVVAVLAVLKAGGVYVPLDPAYPPERLRFMVEDCAPCMLLLDAAGRAVLPACSPALRVIEVEPSAAWSAHPTSNPRRETVGLTAEHLAYMIYTSGSSGTPKGVMIEHRHVTRLFAATRAGFDFQSSDAWTLFHSYAFDFSVWELWGALLHGARLVVVPLATARAPQQFYELVCRAGITVLNQTPSAFRPLIEAQQHSSQSHGLRYVIFGGEALDEALLAPWYAQPRNQATQLVNMYGITETTVHVTYRALDARDAARPSGSIGTPLPDLGVRILDAQGAPVPVGIPGEIHVTGAGVARGYWQRPELTAQRFVQDPFAATPGARLYRTGDVGRWRQDGSLQYLGRNDAQIKIRGFRIELGEIEAQLRRDPRLTQVVVLAQEDGSSGQRLVAYYVGAEVSAEALRAQAAASLPHYMVPASYVQVSALPLTVHGKVDRRALAALERNSPARESYHAPEGEREQLLAGLWQALLHLERVGRFDHFFELGGHSMLAVRLIQQLRERGYHLEVLSLFAHPTLSALAQHLRRGAVLEVPPNLIPPHCTALTPEMLPLVSLAHADLERIVASIPGGAGNVQDIYPLTPLQEGMLYQGLLEAEDVYVLRTLLHVDTEAQLQRWVAALAALITRHDILRTAVLWEGLPQPVQVVVRQARLEVHEVQLEACGRSAAEQMRERFENARVDVRRAPMQRVYVAREVSGTGWVLLLISHHLIEDHSTLQQLVAELAASLHGRAAPAPTASFRDFVAQTQRSEAAAHEAFFGRMLAAIDTPTLPYGLEKVTAGGRHQRRASVVLEVGVGQRLRRCARALGVGSASVFHVAWAQVLARTASCERVVFGTVLVGRMHGGAGTGVFINTLPIRIDVDDREVSAHVQAAHALLAQLLQHEHASLALAQRCSHVPASRPLFSALLNYRHAPEDTLEALRRHGIELLWNDERTHYPLTLLVDDRDDRFELTALVQAPVAPERVCALMTTALTHLVNALEQAPATPLDHLEVLPESERHAQAAWNTPRQHFATERCVHELFEAHVERSPHAIAVEFEEHALSYAELNRQANAWAHRLRALGIGPGSLVALCVQRSLNTVVSVLAVLKAGGAYVPLDPSYPAQRLQLMLEDCRPQVLMIDAVSRAALPGLDPSLTLIDLEDVQQCAGQPLDNLSTTALGLSPRDLAYVIYTSGSTGTPKGVMVEHANLTRLLAASAPGFEFQPTDVWSLFHSYAFDFSVWELWGALTHGARLIVVPWETARNAARFHRLICNRGITVLNQTPSAFRPLITAQAESPKPHRLRYVIFGGEALETTSLRPWYAQPLNEAVQLVNMYGITETTVHATYKALRRTDAEQGTASVGRRLPDLTLHLLDTRGRPVPLGVVGEIYVGGAGVARGYLNREALTAQRFLRDPLSAEPEARLYRSGDLGCWREDGELDYLGRNDAQVKLRGFRIELGEIEAQLRALPGVADAVVSARPGSDGERRLLGYYVCRAEASVEAQQLKAQLSARLPAYMVPTALIELAQLPLTSHGKLDHAGLPEPAREALSAQPYQPPHGAIEQRVATLWQELLHVEQVGRHDNFFELGGNSLLAMRLAARVQQAFGCRMPLSTWLEDPVLARLAEQLSEVQAAEGLALASLEPDREHEHEPFPMTPLQLAYWLGRNDGFELGNVGAHVYLELPVIAVEVARFEQALNRLIARHGMLRMVVTAQGSQRILPSVPRYAVRVNDWRAVSAQAAQQRLEAVRAEMSHQVFSGNEWPLFDFRVSLLGTRAVIHMSVDALMLDASSGLIAREELLALYADPQRELPPLELSFRDYVLARQHLERSALYEQARRYWLERLPSFPAAPDLPLACDPAQITTPRFERRSHQIREPHWRAVLAGAQRHHATPTALFLTCLGEVLNRWAQHPRFALNLTLFNRLPLHAQVDRLVGDFTTLTLLDMDFGTQVSFLERLRATRQQLWSDLEQRYFDGVEVIQALRQSRAQVRYPIVVTSTLGLPQSATAAGAPTPASALVPAGEEYSISQTSQVWLDVQVFEQAGGIAYHWDSVAGLFPAGLLDAMFAAFNALLERLATDPSSWQRPVTIELPASQRQLITAANATERRFAGGLLHQPVLQQILARPDKVALRTADRSLSYAELGQRSAGLATQLLQGGARRNQPIAIVMEKGWPQIIAVLGILRAGAAYVPIDAGWPTERIALLLENVAVEQVVTTARYASRVPAQYSRHLIGDAFECAPGDAALQVQGEPQDLAYVIFTSGSTGVPKGVMIEHGAALNTVLDINERYAVGAEDCVLGLSNLSFDLSVYDIFGVLGAGGTLILPRPEEYRDPSAWLPYLQPGDGAAAVTLWNTVPALLQMLVETLEDRATCLDLRLVMLSGDWIPVDLPPRIRALAPQARLISLGGATEASIWSIAYPIEMLDPRWKSIPYGRALANQQVHVLQRDLSPAPVWVRGDLYIGGAGLARGYWADERKTASSFIRDPHTGARLYRTGDRGRWLPEGNIEFLGREDQQVKIQGHRIELGEIEARLKSHPDISDAVAVLHTHERSQHLVAYVVSKPLEAAGDSAQQPTGVQYASVIQKLEFKLAHKAVPSSEGRAVLDLPVGAQERLALRSPQQHSLSDEDAPITLAALGELLHAYSRVTLQGQLFAKAFYPSGGTLYPVQVYVQIAARRVQLPTGGFVAAGYYCYQPLTHQLIELGAGSNTAADEPAVLRVLFVADSSAIEPLYGPMSEVLCRLEAGYMAHLLEHAWALAVRAEEVERFDCGMIPQMHAQHRLLAAYSVGAPRLTATTAHLQPSGELMEIVRCDARGCQFALKAALPGVQLVRSARKSYRSYSSGAPVLESLLLMLAAARTVMSNTTLTLYLHVRKELASRGGAHRLATGIYSYEASHACQEMGLQWVGGAGAGLVLFPGDNAAIERHADFSVLLVGTREHSAEKHGHAGMIGQVLSNYGVAVQVGMCAVGLPQTGVIEPALQLSDRQHVYHALLGGIVSAAQIGAIEASVAPRADLLEELTRHLRAGLPHYMIPQQLIAIPSVPLSANGKVDRQALPAPDLSDRSAQHYEPPRGEIEVVLASIWRELLHLEHVGRHDNFFQLGGTSLLVIKSVTRARQVLGVEVPARVVFTSPTVSALATHIEESLPQSAVTDQAYESGVI